MAKAAIGGGVATLAIGGLAVWWLFFRGKPALAAPGVPMGPAAGEGPAIPTMENIPMASDAASAKAAKLGKMLNNEMIGALIYFSIIPSDALATKSPVLAVPEIDRVVKEFADRAEFPTYYVPNSWVNHHHSLWNAKFPDQQIKTPYLFELDETIGPANGDIAGYFGWGYDSRSLNNSYGLTYGANALVRGSC